MSRVAASIQGFTTVRFKEKWGKQTVMERAARIGLVGEINARGSRSRTRVAAGASSRDEGLDLRKSGTTVHTRHTWRITGYINGRQGCIDGLDCRIQTSVKLRNSCVPTRVHASSIAACAHTNTATRARTAIAWGGIFRGRSSRAAMAKTAPCPTARRVAATRHESE
jgi:hypothetical protein